MYRKYFFKSKGVLSRKFVASGLAAVFSAGMFGSYAGAVEEMMDNDKVLYPVEELEVQFLDGIKEDDENTKKVFRFLINSNDLLEVASFFDTYEDEDNNKLSSDRGFVVRAVAYALLSKFYGSKGKFSSIEDILIKAALSFRTQLLGLSFLKEESKKFLLNKIKRGWGKKILEKLEKERSEKQGNLGIINIYLNNDNYEFEKNIGNKTKNKFCKNIIFIFVAIILLSVIVAKILAGKSKTNTGVPNNNNKDDEKVNPPTDPEQNQEPKNPEQGNQEQENQDQKSSVVPNNILKVIGTTVCAGTLAGGGTYLFNEVLKRGKPSEVKNLRNVDGEFTYLDSDGNKVTKTEEDEEKNSSVDNVEDKSAEENKSLESSEPTDTEESDSDNKKDY